MAETESHEVAALILGCNRTTGSNTMEVLAWWDEETHVRHRGPLPSSYIWRAVKRPA